jgi:hypothetical protein
LLRDAFQFRVVGEGHTAPQRIGGELFAEGVSELRNCK